MDKLLFICILDCYFIQDPHCLLRHYCTNISASVVYEHSRKMTEKLTVIPISNNGHIQIQGMERTFNKLRMEKVNQYLT